MKEKWKALDQHWPIILCQKQTPKVKTIIAVNTYNFFE